MKSVLLSEFKKNPDYYLSQAPIALKVSGKKRFVILDAKEFGSINETLHLNSTPANTVRLMESIRQDKKR